MTNHEHHEDPVAWLERFVDAIELVRLVAMQHAALTLYRERLVSMCGGDVILHRMRLDEKYAAERARSRALASCPPAIDTLAACGPCAPGVFSGATASGLLPYFFSSPALSDLRWRRRVEPSADEESAEVHFSIELGPIELRASSYGWWSVWISGQSQASDRVNAFECGHHGWSVRQQAMRAAIIAALSFVTGRGDDIDASMERALRDLTWWTSPPSLLDEERLAEAPAAIKTWLEDLYVHARFRRHHEAQTRILEQLDELFSSGLFETADQILRFADLDRLWERDWIALLSFSKPASDKLPSREALWCRIFARMSRSYPEMAERKLDRVR